MASLKRISNKENINNEIEHLLKECDEKKQNINTIKKNAISLNEKSKDFTINSEMVDSRAAYAISLYSKISNITWDYKAPSGKLAGCKHLISLLSNNL